MNNKLILLGLSLMLTGSPLFAGKFDVSLEDDSISTKGRPVRLHVVYGPAIVAYSEPTVDELNNNKYLFSVDLDDDLVKESPTIYFYLDSQKQANVPMTPSSDTYYITTLCEVNSFNEEKPLSLLSLYRKPSDMFDEFEVTELSYQ
jgi:hypothetical protein